MSNRTAPHAADQRADRRPADVRRVAGADTALPRGKSQLIIDAHDRVQGMNSVVETVSMLGLRERRRLERDLHDGAQQRLVSLAVTLRMAREKLGPDAGEAGRLLDRSRKELDEALKEIRELARGIHPTVLSDRGLGAAIEALAHRAPLPVEVDEVPAQELPEQVELAAYFVVSEALTNVAKHACATHASVTVTNGNGWLAVEVSDDGVGGADIALGTGLRGLSDRLAAINGQLGIDSDPGHGTTLRASIPCPSPLSGGGRPGQRFPQQTNRATSESVACP